MTKSPFKFSAQRTRVPIAVMVALAGFFPLGAASQPLPPDPANSARDGPNGAAAQTYEGPEQTNPLILLILQDVKGAPSPTIEEVRKEQAALEAFYSRPAAATLWVQPNGFSSSARQVMAELANADAFGLDSGEFPIPSIADGPLSDDDLAKAELTLTRLVLKYARHAKGGRAEVGKLGGQFTEPVALPEPIVILDGLEKSADRADYLRKLHPQHPEFQALRQKLAELRQSQSDQARPPLPDGPVLRRGGTHPNVAALRKRLGLEPHTQAAGDQAQFDRELEDAVKKFQRNKGLFADGMVGPSTRQALNNDGPEQTIQRILVNMERWRWLPENLGGDTGLYVWANIPEFRVRVIKNGQTVLSERAIVGKVDKQTPVFSDQIEWIEIHPTWYVPNSIKVEDILPSLKRSTSRIMERYHLRMDCGANGRDPAKVDWNRVDIRTCSFSQPPGEKSVLGDFKFKFPNKHSVYMHDTMHTRLFDGKVRAYSHGCIRVENPRRMAEILLDHENSLSSDRIGEILAGPKQLHKQELTRPVPVHLTYFTAGFDENGAFVVRPDYYGHDRSLADLLTGKGNLLPAAEIPGRRARTVRRRQRPVQKDNWWDQITMQN